MDTIFSLATTPGKSGVAVIRISGGAAWSAAGMLCRDLPEPRIAALRILRDLQGNRLDQAVVILFESGASFTGEEIAEFQVHGSPAVISAILRCLGEIPGLRQADAGEFTRRALENGQLDLAQVEGLADLLEAETEAQRKQALRVLAGDLGRVADGWRRDLIRSAALIEATIDFADEDVPSDVTPEVKLLIDRTLAALEREIAGVEAAERVRSGFEVAIVGAPNVGKSTLLNALAGREAAIISEFAGTTRDVIEVRMDLNGLPVTVLDTAGLRETEDHVESIGISRALERAQMADLRVFLLSEAETPALAPSPGDLIYRAKGDLLPEQDRRISGLTGEGVPELIAEITETLTARSASAGLAIRERHRAAMLSAADSLGAARSLLLSQPDRFDILAEELQTAVRALDSLVGRVDVENLLDEIFSSFCIGK